MRVLALSPYHGGSHKAFFRGWQARSRHEWTTLALPAHGWKWRMRHGAVTFADELHGRVGSGERWDLVVATDMLDLAAFRGLAPGPVCGLPMLLYFHENQFAYPVPEGRTRDIHFGLTNALSALAADAAWFNSAHNRDSFLDGLAGALKRMPAPRLEDAPGRIRERASIEPPGIDPPPAPPRERKSGPLRIAWAARWEHDKGPEVFFAALDRLLADGVAFRLSVLGESFRHVPAVFGEARERFSAQIDQWGFLPGRDAYLDALRLSDVIVSTALHEFFGLSVLEAAAAGCLPVAPGGLAYPEVLADLPSTRFHENTPAGLATALASLARRVADTPQTPLLPGDEAERIPARYAWAVRAPALDDALVRVYREG